MCVVDSGNGFACVFFVCVGMCVCVYDAIVYYFVSVCLLVHYVTVCVCVSVDRLSLVWHWVCSC